MDALHVKYEVLVAKVTMVKFNHHIMFFLELNFGGANPLAIKDLLVQVKTRRINLINNKKYGKFYSKQGSMVASTLT
jgi:hypothetical protein